jgi:hypothetical protein
MATLGIVVTGPLGSVTFDTYDSEWIIRKLAYGLDSEGHEADPDTREEIESWAKRIIDSMRSSEVEGSSPSSKL